MWDLSCVSDSRSLSPDQLAAVRALLPSLSRRDRLLWLVSYHCAYRIRETLSVRVGDVSPCSEPRAKYDRCCGSNGHA